jgi:CBS domain-containing protein
VVREYAVSPRARIRVEDVMGRDVPAVPAAMEVDLLLRHLAAHDPVLGRRQSWPIVTEDGVLAGIITRGDLVKTIERADDPEPSVLEAGSRTLVVAYPDELLDEAVDKMVRRGVGRLPVVERADPTRLVGYLGRSGIAAAWRELLREEQIQETGWLSSRTRLLRMKLRRVLSDNPERSA